MNEYQQEQLETLRMIREYLAHIGPERVQRLKYQIDNYIKLRDDIDRYLNNNFNKICTLSCYSNQRSACCSKDGIVVFYADLLINALMMDAQELDTIMGILENPNRSMKCVYLGRDGCRLTVRPRVCAMFLCDSACERVFDENPDCRGQWERLKEEEKRFTWPDRPVLFELLEKDALDRGFRSSLMHLLLSPGLCRVRILAGREDPGYAKKGERKEGR
jgi:hypothetical protein